LDYISGEKVNDLFSSKRTFFKRGKIFNEEEEEKLDMENFDDIIPYDNSVTR
jgi:hypothetical protein